MGISSAVLLTLAVAYYFTYEPAPQVRVRWRDGITPERQAALERRFRLVNRRGAGDRFSYDLLDTTRQNLQALVDERDIYDTDQVDRERAAIRPDNPYGESWMWVAHRLPVLRLPGMVESIIAACAIVFAASVAVLMSARRVSGRPRATEPT